MKKKTFLTTAAALLLLAASCGQPAGSSSESLKFATIDIEDFLKHPQATNEEEGLKYKISFIYPEQYAVKNVLTALQRDFIAHVLGSKYASLAPEAAVKACIEDWKKEYLDQTGKEPLAYHYLCADTVLFVNDALLQMVTYGYVFAGGAHGMESFEAHLFNLQTGKEYSRSDIFKTDTDSENNLRWLIRAELLKYWEKEEDDDLSMEEEAVWNDNTHFAVIDEGVIVLYTDYQLGSYSLGSPKIALPFITIFPFLRPETPVWEVAKKTVTGALDDKVRAWLKQEGVGIGSTLEALLHRYLKYKIEIYYDETGAFEYNTVEEMFQGYGTEWSSAYNGWALFTPLDADGTEAEVRFCILFNDLDKPNKYKKTSTVWFATENTHEEAAALASAPATSSYWDLKTVANGIATLVPELNGLLRQPTEEKDFFISYDMETGHRTDVLQIYTYEPSSAVTDIALVSYTNTESPSGCWLKCFHIDRKTGNITKADLPFTLPHPSIFDNEVFGKSDGSYWSQKSTIFENGDVLVVASPSMAWRCAFLVRWSEKTGFTLLKRTAYDHVNIQIAADNAGTEKYVQNVISPNFQRINNTKNWVYVEEKENFDLSLDGAALTYYYAKNGLEKAVAKLYGETYECVVEYYFLDGRLSLIYDVTTRYGSDKYANERPANAPPDTKIERRWYLKGNQCIRGVGDKDKKLTPAQIEEEFLGDGGAFSLFMQIMEL